jgi:hypothetical protein
MVSLVDSDTRNLDGVNYLEVPSPLHTNNRFTIHHPPSTRYSTYQYLISSAPEFDSFAQTFGVESSQTGSFAYSFVRQSSLP